MIYKFKRNNSIEIKKLSYLQLPIILFAVIQLFVTTLKAQVKTGDEPTSIKNSSLLAVESSAEISILMMTEIERDVIPSPALGIQILNTTTNQPNFYTGTAWTSGANQMCHAKRLYRKDSDGTIRKVPFNNTSDGVLFPRGGNDILSPISISTPWNIPDHFTALYTETDSEGDI